MQLLLLILLSSLLSLSLSVRKIIITGSTGVLGNALVKVLTSTSSLVPTSIYVGYRDIKKFETIYQNEQFFLKYLHSNSNSNSNSNENSNNVIVFPIYINLDDDLYIDISFLDDNNNNNDDDVILINNAAVYMNGNDHDVMIKSLKYNCIEPGILITITIILY